MKRTITAILAALMTTAGAAAQESTPTRLILVVGDGVGLAQWTAARITSEEPLAIDRLPTIGLMDTRCACNRTTDSGAAATAFATGARTGYQFVGMGPDSTPRTSVLEAAEARGLATGLVTTSYITDATPAAFGADVPNRYDRESIAAQYFQKDIEVLLGGGRYFFEHRKDGRDLWRELGDRYTTVATRAEFDALDIARTDRLVGLFADSTIYPNNQLRPTLPALARAALAILDRNPRGFFLLLESEDTDELSHGNDTLPRLMAGMRELDSTIAVALEYQARHPETLILVLGDHETGALSLQMRRAGNLATRFSSTDHTAVSTMIFAGGPGAAQFGRWLGNDQVGQLLLQHVDGSGTRGP